jgi:sigma-B regulation protein RsbU (phosphoserine phosphatase)
MREKRRSAGDRFSRMIREDLKDIKRSGLEHTIRNEYEELKEIMLTRERSERLETMSLFRRSYMIPWWFLKSLIQKLSPFRRILVLIGIIIVLAEFSGNDNGPSYTLIGSLILLFVLLLELKDKLLAREELEAGRAIQKSLRPPPSPSVPGWDIWLFTRSANEVGGDLLGFVPISKNRYGIGLGDISGKGLPAALLSAKLQAALEAIVPDTDSMAVLGTRLNRIFHQYGLPHLFASLMYVELKPRSGKVRFLNAGHFPPMVIRKRGVERLEKGDTALGLSQTTKYRERRISLKEGDGLFLYSDGLVEARNAEGEFYGEERVLGLLSAAGGKPVRETGERIVADVDRFVGKTRIFDDLSIAVIRFGTNSS